MYEFAQVNKWHFQSLYRCKKSWETFCRLTATFLLRRKRCLWRNCAEFGQRDRRWRRMKKRCNLLLEEAKYLKAKDAKESEERKQNWQQEGTRTHSCRQWCLVIPIGCAPGEASHWLATLMIRYGLFFPKRVERHRAKGGLPSPPCLLSSSLSLFGTSSFATYLRRKEHGNGALARGRFRTSWMNRIPTNRALLC